MSKRKITMIVLSLLVIIGLGFAGYSAMNKGNKSANNSYNSDKTSASSTAKAPAKSASSASSTATSKPEEKATGKTKSSAAALKNESQENKSQAKIATIKKNHHSSAAKVVATAKTPSKRASTCSLTVRGPISKGNKVMLRGTRVEITRGETVASVLKKVAKQKHVSLAYQGGGGSTYIRGIGGLFEFDHGSGSGWLYSVNNKFPGYAAGKKKVKSGDNIQWLYTENLGKDRHSPVASQR